MEFGYFQRRKKLLRTDIAYRLKEAMELLENSLVKQVAAYQVTVFLSVEVINFLTCAFVY